MKAQKQFGRSIKWGSSLYSSSAINDRAVIRYISEDYVTYIQRILLPLQCTQAIASDLKIGAFNGAQSATEYFEDCTHE